MEAGEKILFRVGLNEIEINAETILFKSGLSEMEVTPEKILMKAPEVETITGSPAPVPEVIEEIIAPPEVIESPIAIESALTKPGRG